MSKVSIIMVVHNQIDFTKKAIESLYQFTDEKDFELIVVDNWSTDGTGDFLAKLPKINLKYRYKSNNFGWCHGLNMGIEFISSDSDFVLWCNNDLLFEKDWLPKMIAHFRPGVGAVGPTSNYVNGRQRIELNDGSWEEEVQWLIGFFLMFRRGIIDAIGEVDERFDKGGCEEWDYIIQMQQKLGLKCVIARDVYIHHFGSQTIMNTVCKNKEEYDQYCLDAIKILKDKWGDEFIEKWLPQAISRQIIEDSRSPWPSNCKLGLAMPHTWPNIDYDTHLSMLAIRHPNMVVLETGSGGELDTKRETQIINGMNQECTHFWIADGDMRFPQKILIDLFEILKDGADLAGGLCYRGYPPWDPIAWHPTENRMLIPFQDFKFGDIIDSGAVGCACLLVKREVFEKLPRPWFQNRFEKVFDEKGESAVEYEEGDHYFTRKATRAGFKLRILTKYDVDHLRKFAVNRDLWITQGLLSRCGDWGTIISLYKKLGNKEWINRELKGDTVGIDWQINQKPYEIGILYNFLLGKQIKNVLEIGTQNGGTALLWAKMVESRDGHVYCVDREFPEKLVYSDSELRHRITEIRGDSHNWSTFLEVDKLIQSNGGMVDFLFFDGDHTYPGVKADFESFSLMVKPGGWIAFHDIRDSEWHRSQNCNVAKFWEEIKNRFNHFEILDPNDRKWMGIGVLEWKE